MVCSVLVSRIIRPNGEQLLFWEGYGGGGEETQREEEGVCEGKIEEAAVL